MLQKFASIQNRILSQIRSCYFFQQEVSLISKKTLKATCVKKKFIFSNDSYFSVLLLLIVGCGRKIFIFCFNNIYTYTQIPFHCKLQKRIKAVLLYGYSYFFPILVISFLHYNSLRVILYIWNLFRRLKIHL